MGKNKEGAMLYIFKIIQHYSFINDCYRKTKHCIFKSWLGSSL